MLLEYEAKKVNWKKLFLELESEELSSEKFASLTTTTADLFKNKPFNRYYNVLPYDQSRVRLKHLDRELYINANHVRVPEAARKYILTQGPLENTVDHFWLMCYQERTDVIVMLCNCWENSREKSAEYWPAEVGGSLPTSFGLVIEQLDRKDCDHYILRTLRIKNIEGGEDREVKHFHYYNWPDFNVPKCPDAFLNFLQAVRDTGCFEPSSPGGPPVVHCSAGIGRSGTFCLVDSCLVLAAEGKELSMATVRSVLMAMRGQRMGLIQTEDQLRFSVSAIIAGHSRFCSPAADTATIITTAALNGHSSSNNATTGDTAATCKIITNGTAAVEGGGGKSAAALSNGKRLSERDELAAACSLQPQQSSSKKRRSSTLSDS